MNLKQESHGSQIEKQASGLAGSLELKCFSHINGEAEEGGLEREG